MSAQLATADDRLWARECQDRSIRNGPIVPETLVFGDEKSQFHQQCFGRE
jgi:hypothetical protein